MKIKKLSSITLASLATLCLTTAVMADGPEFEPDRVFVRINPGASIAAINQTYGTTLVNGASVPSRGLYLLDLPAGASESTFVSLMQSDTRIAEADFNFYVADGNPNGTTRRMYLSATPGRFEAEPFPDTIDLVPAWSQSRGRGVVIAIIDTGVDATHPLLAKSIAPGGYNFVTSSVNTLDVAQGVDTDSNVEFDELFGHGTLVAGLALRVAPDAQILPIVAMDSDGYATIFRMVQGLYHALDKGANVANLSMGMEADPALLRQAIADVEAQGMVVVASAGNRANSNPDYPAGSSDIGTLAIAATDNLDRKAEFSNYGTWVSLSAPGVDIASTVPGGFGVASGTSLSAPIVAGAAANVRSICPLIAAAQVDAYLRLHATPIDGVNPGFVGELGAGRLSVAQSVGALGETLPCDCDPNNDRLVSIDDVYLLTVTPIDAKGDGIINQTDTTALRSWLRRGERAELMRAR